MFKKVIPIVVALCLVFSVSAIAENQTDPVIPAEAPQEMPTQGDRMRTPPQMPNGERPQGGNRGGQMPQGEFTPPQNNEANNSEREVPATPQENNIPQNKNNQDVNNATENVPENNSQNQEEVSKQNGQQNRQFSGGMQGGFPGEMQNNDQNTETAEPTGFIGFLKTYSTPITSVILLAVAFVFVIFYKRRNY